MNEYAGRKVFDLSGNHYTGDFVNDVGSAVWQPRGVYFLNGDDPYINVPHHTKQNVTQLTVVVEFRSDSSGTFQYIFGKTANSSSWTGWCIYQHGTVIHFATGAYNQSVVSNALSVGSGEVYQVIGTFDGINAKIYINGQYHNTATPIWNDGAANPIKFGVNQSTYDLIGAVHYAYFYDNVKADREIAELYRDPYAIFQPVFNPTLFGYVSVAPPAGIEIFRRRIEGY